MSKHTLQQYDRQIARCRELFRHKVHDYGTSWRVLRMSSLTDQLFIKAQRIRTLEEKKVSKVGDGVEPEWMALVNYSVIALLQLQYFQDERIELPEEVVMAAYDRSVQETRDLMMAKNHDYGEAWRDMRVESFTDLILMKLLRIRQLESLSGQARVSEGTDAGYRDILNYAVFALIKLEEQNQNP